MTDALIDAVLRSWAHQRDFAQRLLSDLDDAEMCAQPIPGVVMNHAAWTLSHLSAYPPVLRDILLDRPATDPLDHRYGRQSAPRADPAEYLPRSELVADYLRVHDELAAAMSAVSPDRLRRPVPLERWAARWPRIADAAVHLMVHHEGVHLGQLSAWRRALGKPRV